MTAHGRRCAGNITEADGGTIGAEIIAFASGVTSMVDGKRTILVVDDDVQMLQMARMILEEEGYEVCTAADGLEALQSVEQRMPDLILLDWRMPVMDGATFAAEFRAKYGDSAPILLLTAGNDPEGAAERIGAVASLGKPFDLDSLIAAVEGHVGRRTI